MTSILPPIPCFVFTIFEPLSLLAGWLGPTFFTEYFAKSQLPSNNNAWTSSNWPTTKILTLQLGNVYGLLAMVGIGVLYQTTEAKVVRNFILACAIADLGHLFVTYTVMERHFWDVSHWNDVAWGNIGVTTFLFIIRCLYLAGTLGDDRIPQTTKQKSGKDA